MKNEELILARIHAHLCGDGCLCVYKTSEPDRINRAAIIYSNNSETLLKEFQQDMQSFFGVKMTISSKKNEVRVQSLRIAQFLLSLSQFHSRSWSIPSRFMNANREVKLAWITAFAQDEGYVMKDRRCIRIKCVNLEGLKQVKALLTSLEIQSNLTGPNCDETWYLNIRPEKELLTFRKVACRT